MRGHDERQEGMFTYISAEKRVPLDHPLRRVRAMTDQALEQMSPGFSELYSLRAALNHAGEIVASVAAAGALQRARRKGC